MADSVPTEFYYRLACSSFVVQGSVETTATFKTGEPETKSEVDINLSVHADRRQAARVRVPQHAGSGSYDCTIKLLSDGRLASATGSAQGILGDVISAGVTVGTFVAGLAVSAVAPGVRGGPEAGPLDEGSGPDADRVNGPAKRAMPAPPKPAPQTPETRWRAECDTDAHRLDTALTTLGKLHDALVTTAGDTGDADPPTATHRKLLSIEAGIKAVEGEVASITSRRDAWVNANYRSSTSYRFALPTDDVFELSGDTALGPGSTAPDTLDPAHLKDGSELANAMLARLGVAIVDVTPLSEDDRATTEDAQVVTELADDVEHGKRPPGVFFRVPRPAVFAVYEAKEWSKDQAPMQLMLSSIERVWVIDDRSRLGSVPLQVDRSRLPGRGDVAASITFSDAGVPDTIGISEKSELSAALKALASAPEKAAAALESAKNASAAWDALRASPADRQIAALENRKKLLEADIATRGLEADAVNGKTLQMLKDELERLKTTKAISAEVAPASPEELLDAAERAKLARLRVELGIARTSEQLEDYSAMP